MLLTCVAFITRSVFRAIEFAGGYDGVSPLPEVSLLLEIYRLLTCLMPFLQYVQTTEAFFYCLDALPIFLGLLVFIAFYPPRFFMDRIFWDEPAVSEAASTAPLDKEDSFRMSQMKSQRSGGYSQPQQQGYSQGQYAGYSQEQQRSYHQAQRV